MSAFLEFRQTGQLGPEGAKLLYETTSRVIRDGRYPPPDGERWTTDDVIGVAHEFLASLGESGRTGAVFLRAQDDDSLGALLYTAVRNHVRSEMRKTDGGALFDKVRAILRGDERFAELETPGGSAFYLQRVSAEDVWAGRHSDLVNVAYSVETRVLRYRTGSRRDPEADDESFATVLEHVLEAAAAPMLLTDLHEVMSQRFALYGAPALVALDDEPAGAGQTPEDQVDVADAVKDIWDQLTSRERQVLAAYDTVRELGTSLELGKTQASAARRQLDDTLRRLLRDVGDPERALDQLRQLAEVWAGGRTEGGPSALKHE